MSVAKMQVDIHLFFFFCPKELLCLYTLLLIIIIIKVGMNRIEFYMVEFQHTTISICSFFLLLELKHWKNSILNVCGDSRHWLVSSVQQMFTEHLLFSKQCSAFWGYTNGTLILSRYLQFQGRGTHSYESI